VRERVTSVPAHVLLECYSVLTRLPSPHRISADDAAEALAGLDLEPIALPARKHAGIITALGSVGIRGGAVYDGLVAATVLHHKRHLLTLDRRARTVYDAIGVGYTLV
jgi:predicted nucleic acid-binding protein